MSYTALSGIKRLSLSFYDDVLFWSVVRFMSADIDQKGYTQVIEIEYKT